MSIDADIRKLERQWKDETANLKARIAHLADTLEHKVSAAQWVARHPYIATAGAATVGFVAAQVGLEPFIAVSRAAFAAPAPTAVPPRPVAPPAAAPAPPASPWADIFSLVVNVAQQFLAPQAGIRPASLIIANAGSIVGSANPFPFSPQPRESPERTR